MPPLPVWFTGRDTVTRFLPQRAFAEPGDVALVATAANGQRAVTEYLRAADNVMRAHSIHVLDTETAGVAELTIFLIPGCFLRLVCRQRGDPCRAGCGSRSRGALMGAVDVV
jgi:RNA polymerase sigma-70 factor (ECF subfamily)